MADPIQINLYIKSLGLSGKEAELKSNELAKLSNEELNNLISGKKAAAETPTWGLDNLKETGKYSGGQLFSYSQDNGAMGWSGTAKSEPKKYSPGEQRDLRQFAGDFLYNSSNNAYQSMKKVNDDIGFVSFTKAANNMRVLAFQDTTYDKENAFGEEIKKAERLKGLANHAGKFEYNFEKERTISFSPENIEKLKQKSEEFTMVSAFHDKYEQLSQGLNEVRQIVREETEYKNAMKVSKGVGLTPPKVSSHEKFGEVLLDFCNGDKELAAKYLEQIKTKKDSKESIEQNYTQILSELQENCKKQYNKQLGGKTYEQHEQEYKNTCKKAIGSEDSEQLAKNYIESTKMLAGIAEVVTIMTVSLVVPGLGVTGRVGTKLAVQFGEKAAANMMKAGMTTMLASTPAAISTVDALTSNNGLTAEKKAEILEKWRNGLMYGGLGACVSGPIGNAIEKLIVTKPNVLTNVVKQAFNEKGLNRAAKASGLAAETSADVVIDMIAQNGDLLSSLKNNGGMNIGMMIAGGRLAKMFNNNMPKATIEQHSDGSYLLKDANGKLVFKAADENILATFMLGKAVETQDGGLPMAAGDADLIRENPSKFAAQKLQDKVGLKLDNTPQRKQNFPEAPLRYERPSNEFIDVLKHFDPKVMEAHYEKLGDNINETIKKHSSEIDHLTQNFTNNKQGFAEGFLKILANEHGMKSLTPEVILKDTGDNDGYWDWASGKLIINKNINDPKKVAVMIGHEFRHVLQYKDILTKYGEDGLRQLCKNEKDPDIYNSILNLPYTQKLLQYGKEHPHAKDGLNDYMSRIYADEFSDYKNSDHPDYLNQLSEQDAYYLGNNRTNRAYAENESQGNDNQLSGFRAKLKARLIQGGSIEPKPQIFDGTPVEKNYTVDEFGQIIRNIPAGRLHLDPENPIKTVSRFATDNGISVYSMQKYVEGGLFVVDKSGKIDTQNPANIKGLEHINDPNLVTREEIAEMFGVVPEYVSSYVRSGELVMDITNKYDVTNEQNAKLIKKIQEKNNPDKISQKELGRTLNIDPHAVANQIKKGNLVADENGRVDLSNPQNIDFIDNGQDKTLLKKNRKPEPEAEPKEIIEIPSISVRNFAEQYGISKLQVEKAIARGDIKLNEKGRIDPTHKDNIEFAKARGAESKTNPNLKSTQEIMDMLGLANQSTVSYNLKNGRLQREPNGLYDISKEPNKSFIEAKLSGTYKNLKDMTSQKKEMTQGETLKSQTEIAAQLGISIPSLSWHIMQGHLNSVGRGKIDISDPKNVYFIETFQKGKTKHTYEEFTQHKENDPDYNPQMTMVNPNEVTVKTLAQMTGLTITPILYHLSKGRLVRGENGKFDINDPQNKMFLQKYSDAAQEKYNNMSQEELTAAKEGLQKSLLPFIGCETYINSANLLNISKEEFNKYIEYTTDKVVDTQNMEAAERSALGDLFKDVIRERINNKSLPNDFSDIGLIALTSKCEIEPYKNLLTRLAEPEIAAKEIISTEIRNGYKVEITPDKEFDDVIYSLQSKFETRINTIRAMQDTEKFPPSKVVESFLYNRYLGMKLKGADEVDFFIKRSAIDGKKNPLVNTEKFISEDFIEKILYKERTLPTDNPQFEKFKKCFDTKRIAASIEELKENYRNQFYYLACNKEALDVLQDANPHIEVSRENLAAVIFKKFGLNNDFSNTQIVETARYSDRKGRKLPHETELREYIESFHSVRDIKMYNDLVELYNQNCGLNRNDKVALEILEDLKMTDIDGKFDKESILLNKDIIRDIIKKYYKKVQTPKEVEVANLKTEYSEYDVIVDEVQKSMKKAEFPKANEIKPENINNAKLFLGLMNKYAADVDIENIEKVLNNLNENFKGKVSDIADMYQAEPIQSRDEFLSSLTNKDGIQNLREKWVIHNEWKNAPESLNLTSHEYYNLRNKMGLSNSQIYSDKTNLFEVLGVDSYDGLEGFLSASVQAKPNDKIQFIYNAFGQSNIDGLKAYLDNHKIDSFSLRLSSVSKNKLTTTKNSSKIHKNSEALHNIMLNFKNKNTRVEQSLKEITEVFENINGKITLSGNKKDNTPVTSQSIISELKKLTKINEQNYDTLYSHIEYENILREIGINPENLTAGEIRYKLNNLSELQELYLKKISMVLNCESFDNTMTSIHSKMRFMERFMLEDNVNINDMKDCVDYIENFNDVLKKQLNDNVSIGVFQSGTDGSIIAPQLKITDDARTYTITLNDDNKIHTIL